jgi:hypothetical protein
MTDDWRLQGQESYLLGALLTRSRFQATAENDHEHCEFCGRKFSEAEEDLRTGYRTLDAYHWVCNDCYIDFASRFKWRVVASR